MVDKNVSPDEIRGILDTVTSYRGDELVPDTQRIGATALALYDRLEALESKYNEARTKAFNLAEKCGNLHYERDHLRDLNRILHAENQRLCDSLKYAEQEHDETRTPKEASCWCYSCKTEEEQFTTWTSCPDCGNKRCPKATFHDHACTRSNELGQDGSRYGNWNKQSATDTPSKK